MKKAPSRREVLKGTLTAAASLAVPSVMAQTSKTTATATDVYSGLAKPLTPANKVLVEEALLEVAQTSRARHRVVLPENSEPGFVFSVRPGATTTW